MSTPNKGILSSIGHTPFIQLEKVYPDFGLNLHAKLEMFNPGGSIKDRPAAKIITDALDSGTLTPGDTVIESSSGNMAIGLAQVCRYYKLDLIVVVDPKTNSHTLRILKTYGATIEKVTTSDESGNYLSARLQRVQELLDEIPGSFWPNQYANDANPRAHHQTMSEIVEGLPEPPQYLFASVSTCGTIMGCAEYIRAHNLDTQVLAVDAVGSVIFGTSAADRLVPGHGAGRSSDLLNKDFIDHVVHITDQECISGCHHLLNTEAILAGGSSGAVIAAVKKLKDQLPKGANCALILPDSGERYLDTIYNDDWLESHFGETSETIADNGRLPEKKEEDLAVTGKRNTGIDKKCDTQKISIIGGGPKGMYGFERLAAQFKAHPVRRSVEIHIYNKSAHFGAGQIYNPAQPDYLLINNPIGDINMWIDESPAPVAPQALSSTEWLQTKKNLNVTKNDYVSRALVGQYLEHGFEAIAKHLPEGVTGSYFTAEVIDLCEREEKYAITVKTAAGKIQSMPHRYDHVLLATGHPRNKLTKKEKEYQLFAKQNNGTGFVPFIYPVEKNLQDIAPGSAVAMKGIGLTFVDAALALTEGRGGRFERSNNQLHYVRSGNEPETIFPFARSGLPMIPRGPAPENPTPLRFFTEESLNRVKGETPDNKLDFKTHVQPLLYREMAYAFYSVQMKKLNFKDDLHTCASYKEVQHHIDVFHEHHPEVKRFDPELFLQPLSGPQFKSSENYNDAISNYLRFFLDEARKGELESPWAAASAVWRKATPIFAALYAFGGLKPVSQAYFDTEFRRLLNRVTFGPPIESTKKIVALIKAGILNFNLAQNPSVSTSSKDGAFILDCNSLNNRQVVEFLVDARIPNISIERNQSELYQNLEQRGLIKKFTNEYNGDTYLPGCAAISAEGYVINTFETANHAIAMTGTPTEGITFDNDALSRTRNNFVSRWAAEVRNSWAHTLSKTQT